MESVIVACFDVYYYETYAKASCIVFQKDEDERILSEYNVLVHDINEYIPGEFYKRELPCILKLLDEIKENIDLIIVDSFVWLNENKKGLGGYLYEALNGKTPVIGVAKTFFKDSTNYLEVYRGNSNKPLYVSATGLDLNYAAQFVRELDGEYRMPQILKQVDRQSREPCVDNK
ncbi:endonuclease V [Clostridium beijerinckii]|uniref:Deoxyribonuclease V n=1 Tax=Clostridium beijerinckii TaxID=1520 RepID=A0AAX0AWL2_CLOBE|nr:endonuclease V [Clostridium beijerinckii]NOW04392.1 deoxyribonuclease V [Clostridium beijerinckii]NRT35319.1 deoxyribonuclease V [Clostridium beijerinckii]NRT45252.1 deoxyribonuclease V [Clostridium beijerinckii]NRT87331.1 deoxyribonuclease V [Clostridium beijerinckii]NRU38983.1 deoxyribonuclease V [Clostridium beijerinckii]